MERKRVVIAGQTPPPIGGQAVMIARILDDLRAHSSFEVVHLPFYFTRDVRRTRRAGLDKVLELFAVVSRLVGIRASGTIDALLYPVGGPQLVPLLRDVCLLPWILLASRKVIFHFHAGGIAETIHRYPYLLRQLVYFLYSKGDAAIVMTEFGKRDATALGIDNIKVVPHTLTDTYDPDAVRRGAGPAARLLYVGHLCEEKGTPALLEALADLRKTEPNCSLELVGECLPPYSDTEMKSAIRRLDLENAVELSGVLSGKEKWNRFARADLFVFPSLAPESFGLVTVEAMMWALPVIACDWRGNREILGETLGGVCFRPGVNLAISLSNALREAFAHREDWTEWGKRNRQTFENKYKAENFPARFAHALEALV